MRLGVHLVSFATPGGPAGIPAMLAAVGAAAEEAGVDNLSLMDHYLQMEMLGGDHDPMLEGYTTLGFLAAHTSTVELQLLMTGVTYRHPGPARQDRRHARRALRRPRRAGDRRGVVRARAPRVRRPVPAAAERFERLDETLRIVRQMWSDDDGPFEGRHYRLAETICAPRPLHRVPVMVGGNGERKTLRLVAAHADACNLVLGGESAADEARHKFEVLRRHCEELGRDYDGIRRTAMLPRPLDPVHDAARLPPHRTRARRRRRAGGARGAAGRRGHRPRSVRPRPRHPRRTPAVPDLIPTPRKARAPPCLGPSSCSPTPTSSPPA